MTDNTDFPQWICNGYQRIQSQSRCSVGNRLGDCRTEFQNFSRKLSEFPEKIEMYEILTTSPQKIMSEFPHVFGALDHLCEYWIGSWYSQHVCKVRGYLCGLRDSMENGNWLVACACTRNILEDVTHFDFFLRRIEKKFLKMIQLQKNESKRIKKGINPNDSWYNQNIECYLGIIAAARKAIQGSNYDWDSYLDEIAADLGISREELDLEMNSSDKRTHIQKCIDESELHHPFPFKKHYDSLSERCHPNFGSNALAIYKRESKSEKYGTIWFSDKIKNYDGACVFFDIACEPIISTFIVGNKNIVKVMNIHSIFTRMAKKSSSPINNLLTKIDG